MATIKVGDRLPNFTFLILKDGQPHPISVADLFGGKKVAFFAIPGAYTPTCTNSHCPSFRAQAVQLKKLGIDAVLMTSVNDSFVLSHFAEYLKCQEQISMLADGNGDFARSIGMEQDLRSRGLGLRSKRYAMIVHDGVVKWMGLDDKGLDKSSAESLLAVLPTIQW